jgi:hypothetical protein
MLLKFFFPKKPGGGGVFPSEMCGLDITPQNFLPVLWIRICIDFGPLCSDPDPGGQKTRKKGEKFHVLKYWMFSFGG